MSKLICPFCQQELRKIHPTYVICDNCRITGDKELWQALTDSMKEHDLCHDALVERTKELDRTRKALDVAVDALKRLEKELYFNNAKQTGHIADSIMSIPSIALEQITALEQKDKR